MLVTINY